MTCPERDQDLLLLAHGALPWGQTLRARLHLRVCPACRSRYAQLTHVSALLAGHLRDPDMPPWSRPQALAQTVLLTSPWKIALLLAVLLVVLSIGTLITHRLASPVSSGAGSRNTPVAGGCRPDLPNSRCR